MSKKSGVRGTENMRYFHLHETTLTFYETEITEHPNGSVDLEHVRNATFLIPSLSSLLSPPVALYA